MRSGPCGLCVTSTPCSDHDHCTTPDQCSCPHHSAAEAIAAAPDSEFSHECWVENCTRRFESEDGRDMHIKVSHSRQWTEFCVDGLHGRDLRQDSGSGDGACGPATGEGTPKVLLRSPGPEPAPDGFYECRIAKCERSFATKHGLKIHRGRTHPPGLILEAEALERGEVREAEEPKTAPELVEPASPSAPAAPPALREPKVLPEEQLEPLQIEPVGDDECGGLTESGAVCNRQEEHEGDCDVLLVMKPVVMLPQSIAGPIPEIRHPFGPHSDWEPVSDEKAGKLVGVNNMRAALEEALAIAKAERLKVREKMTRVDVELKRLNDEVHGLELALERRTKNVDST